MTQSPNPFTLGTKLAIVKHHGFGTPPSITTAYVAKVTPSGRFQIRYAHMKEGEMSDTVYQPDWVAVSYGNGPNGSPVYGWRGKARNDRWRSKDDVRVWDSSVDELEEKRARIQRTGRLLSEVQQRVSSMRATHEGSEELVEKLADALGITEGGDKPE